LGRSGWTGDEILSLGRPELFMTKQQLQHLVGGLKLSWAEPEIVQIVESKYADLFLQRAGFRTIRSLDASNYEGAEIVHDLNEPIPEALEGTTRFLYANGSIEHVFNVAMALQNIARLLSTGGTALLTAPADGQCGHGFYQFSPEFFYRFFEVYGFEDARVYVVGRKYPQRWFRAKDPWLMKDRVEFMAAEPTEIIAIARKTRGHSLLDKPQQSDYEHGLWHVDAVKPNNNNKWSPKRRTFSSILGNRVLFPCAVGLRYFAGIGMPGLDGHPFFEHVDPLRTQL
jgi:SAM-dependent methyltransferase